MSGNRDLELGVVSHSLFFCGVDDRIFLPFSFSSLHFTDCPGACPSHGGRGPQESVTSPQPLSLSHLIAVRLGFGILASSLSFAYLDPSAFPPFTWPSHSSQTLSEEDPENRAVRTHKTGRHKQFISHGCLMTATLPVAGR